MKLNPIKALKTLFVLIAVVFGIYLLPLNAGNISANAAVAPSTSPIKSGAKIYAVSCARCHGADGKANTPKGRQTNAVDLTGEDWEPDDARDTRIITNGRGKMPGFKRSLKPDDIKSVVVYIRKFK